MSLNNQRIEIPIQGMDCAGCASTVKSAITGVSGVQSVEVLLSSEKAIIQFDNENVFETVPAFKRKNINIDGSNASDQHINTYLSDNNGSMQLRENRFLNKDVD